MNKEVGMLLPKKDLIQVEQGKLIMIVRISTYTSLQPHPLTTPIHCNHTHRFHPLATPTAYQPHPPPTNHAHQPHPQIPPTLQNCHPYCTEVWMTTLKGGWNLWVWLVGVVSRRWVWLMGGIYGYGYKCMGVVSGWCCKEVYY